MDELYHLTALETLGLSWRAAADISPEQWTKLTHACPHLTIVKRGPHYIFGRE